MKKKHEGQDYQLFAIHEALWSSFFFLTLHLQKWTTRMDIMKK